MEGEDGLFHERRSGENNRLKIIEVLPGLIYRVRELNTNVPDLLSVVFPVKYEKLRNMFLEHLDRFLRKDSRMIFPVEGSKCCAFHDGKWSRVTVKHVAGGFRLAESTDNGWCKYMSVTSFSETPPFFDQFEPMALRIKFTDNANSYYKTCDTEEYLVKFLEWKPNTEHWIVEFIGFPRDIEGSPSNTFQAAMSQTAALEKKRENWKYRQPKSYISNTQNPLPSGIAEEPCIIRDTRNATEAANDQNATREINSGIQNITLSESHFSGVPNMNLVGSADAPSTGQPPSNAAKASAPTEIARGKKNRNRKGWKLRRQTAAVSKDLAEGKLLASKSVNTELNKKDSKFVGADMLELGGTQVQNQAKQVGSDEAQSVQAGRAARTNLSSIESQESLTVLPPMVPLTPDQVLNRAFVHWDFFQVGSNHVILNVAYLLQPLAPFDVYGYVHSVTGTEAPHLLKIAVLPAARELLRILLVDGRGPAQTAITFQNQPTANGPCLPPMSGFVWNRYSQNRAQAPSTSMMPLQHTTTLTENNGVIRNDAAQVNSSPDDRSISKSLPVSSNDLLMSEDGKPPQILPPLKASPNQNHVSSKAHTNPSFHSPDFLPTDEPQSNQNRSTPGFPLRWNPPFVTPPVDCGTHAISHPPRYSVPLNSDRLYPIPTQPMVQPSLKSSVQSPPNLSSFVGSPIQHQVPPSVQYAVPHFNEDHHFRNPHLRASAVPNGYPNQIVTNTPMLPEALRNHNATVYPPNHVIPCNRQFTNTVFSPNPIPSSVPADLQPASRASSVLNPVWGPPSFRSSPPAQTVPVPRRAMRYSQHKHSEHSTPYSPASN